VSPNLLLSNKEWRQGKAEDPMKKLCHAPTTPQGVDGGIDGGPC